MYEFYKIKNLLTRWSVIASVIVVAGCQLPSPPSSSMPSPSGIPSSPSSPSSPSNPSSSSSSGDSNSSSAEGASVEDLDQTLEDTLGEFDDDMASTQNSQSADEIDILSPEGNRQLEQDTTAETGTGDTTSGDSAIEQRAEQGAPESSSSADAQSSDNQTATTENATSQERSKAELPEDIDDGQGDDIVLRQIREAALQERDPVLREKLWNEYRRIKNQR